jgi:hypothetical protein
MCGDDTNGWFTFDAYLKPSLENQGIMLDLLKDF